MNSCAPKKVLAYAHPVGSRVLLSGCGSGLICHVADNIPIRSCGQSGRSGQKSSWRTDCGTNSDAWHKRSRSVLTAPSDGMFGDGFRWRFQLLKACSRVVTSVLRWLVNRFGCPSRSERDKIGHMSYSVPRNVPPLGGKGPRRAGHGSACHVVTPRADLPEESLLPPDGDVVSEFENRSGLHSANAVSFACSPNHCRKPLPLRSMTACGV